MSGRLVWASSETLLGYRSKNPPAYVPLDEDVPVEGTQSLCSTDKARRLLDWANGKLTVPVLASGGGAGNDTSPAETRRGRAWIDQAPGVRIGYALTGWSPDRRRA